MKLSLHLCGRRSPGGRETRDPDLRLRVPFAPEERHTVLGSGSRKGPEHLDVLLSYLLPSVPASPHLPSPCGAHGKVTPGRLAHPP